MPATKSKAPTYTTPSKPYDQMTAEELAEATKQFDQEMIIDAARALNAKERKRWQHLKRKRGGQQKGEGCDRVLVTIERGLLREADKLAKKLNTSRAALVSRGLQSVLACEGITVRAENIAEVDKNAVSIKLTSARVKPDMFRKSSRTAGAKVSGTRKRSGRVGSGRRAAPRKGH